MSITVKTAPDPKDVTEFRFHGLRKVRLGGKGKLDGGHGGLLAVVPRAGIVLVGGDQCVHLVRTEDVENQDKICNKQERAQENSTVPKVTIPLPGKLLHVGVSCDGLTASLVIQAGQFASVLLYDTRGLLTNDKPLSVTELNMSPTKVTGVHWNPAIPDMFTVTWEDGRLALFTLSPAGLTDCLTLPPEAGVAAMDWSPKGKQLVVIRRNCDLVQYKPDLSVAKYPKLVEMKTVKGPSQAGHVGVSVTWISTYEFLIGVRDVTESDNVRPSLWLVTGSKAGPVEHRNYDDITYSTGEGAATSYLAHNIAEWGVVAVASSASIELGVLGLEAAGAGYTQWILEDNARAEIPLDSDNEECYPVGMGYDATSSVATPVGEGEGPPSPILYLLSSDGLMCPFYCRNFKPGVPPLCSPGVALAGEKRPGLAELPAVKVAPPPPVPVLTPAATAPASAFPPLSAGISFSLPSGGTSTPKPKETSPFQPPAIDKKPPPPAFGFSKEPSPLSLPPKNTPPPPFGFSKEPSPQSVASKDTQPTMTSKEPTPVAFAKDPSPALSVKSVSSKESTPISDSTNAKIKAAIDEEYLVFEDELKKMKNSIGSMKIDVGTQEDKVNICTRTENCSKFSKDIIDTTKCQNNEIFSLRSSTLETFSWLEEARARDQSGGEHKYAQLLRARPLDPRSVKMMEGLRSQFFYCEQQIEEVGNVLDGMWEEHISKLKRNVRGDKSNVMEELSMAVMTNHRVLDRHHGTVEDLEIKMKKLQAAYPVTFSRGSKSPVKTAVESELDKLAESLRDKSKITPNKSTVKAAVSPASVSIIKTPMSRRNLNVTSPVKGVSPVTDRAIRAALDNRPLSVIKPVTREQENKVTSAKLLERLKQNEPPVPVSPIIKSKSPAKQISKPVSAAVYESISPAGEDKQVTKGITSALTPFGAPSLISKPGFSSFSSPGVSAISKPVTTSAGSGFGFGSSSSASGGSSAASFSLPTQNTSKSNPEASIKPGLGFGLSLSSSGSITPFSSSSTTKAVTTSASAPGFSLSSTAPATGFSLSSAKPVPEVKEIKPTAAAHISASTTAKEPLGSGDSKSGFAFGLAKSAVNQSSTATLTTAVTTATPALGFGLSSTAPSGGLKFPAATKLDFETKTTTLTNTFGASPSSSVLSFGSKSITTTVAETTSSTGNAITAAAIPALGSSASSVTVKNTAASIVPSSVTEIKPVFGGAAPNKTAFGGGASASSGGIFGGSVPATAPGSLNVTKTESPSSAGVSSSTPSTTTTSSGSVFGGSGGSSVFGGAPPNKTAFGGSASSPGGIFGGTSSSVTGGSSTSAPSVSAGSVFGSSSAAPSSSGSVFGSSSTAPASTVSAFGGSTSTSVFGSSKAVTTTSASSVFGSNPQQAAGSVFGGQSGGASAFGGSKGSPSVFGKTPASASSSVFGSAPASTTVSGSVFGSTPASTTASGSVFGSTPNATTATGSVFGSTPASTTASGSVFGSTPTATTATGSVFGSTPASTTASGSVFGSTPASTTASGSVFGSTPTSTTASGSVFGSIPAPTTASGSVFGSTPASTSSSGSVFGSAPFATTASGSVFGATSAVAGAGTSVFGSASGGSVFGSATPTTTDVSGFGSSQISSSSGSVFGSAPAASSGTPAFGSTPASDGASVFGGAAAPGAQPASVFGGSGGGGFLGGLGGAAKAENPNKNPFGGASSTFGSTPSSSGNLFAGSSSSPFSQSSTNSPFGGPSSSSQPSAFGSGGGNVASQGFGVQSNTPSKPATGGFGGAAAFGSPPAFGSSGGFGATPAFGGAPAMGGGSAFGGGSSFGAAASNAPSFGSAASAGGPSFGGAAASGQTFGSMATGSAPAFGGGGGSGFGQPSSPPPAGKQFNSWR